MRLRLKRVFERHRGRRLDFSLLIGWCRQVCLENAIRVDNTEPVERRAARSLRDGEVGNALRFEERGLLLDRGVIILVHERAALLNRHLARRRGSGNRGNRGATGHRPQCGRATFAIVAAAPAVVGHHRDAHGGARAHGQRRGESDSECDDSEGVIDGDRDNYHGQITSSMLCAEHPKRKDACQGDSGGPLVKKSGSGSGEEFELVGVVSWGVGCAHDDFPGVYARVSAEYRWIKEEVCKRSSHPPASFGCKGGSTIQTANTPQNNLFEADDSEPESSSASMFVSNSDSSGSWRTVIEEDFRGGFGKFRTGGEGSKHYPTAKDRSGVALIENTSTLSSNVITLNSGESRIRVDFSAYVVVFEENDKFCLDSSSGGSSYSEEICWSLMTLKTRNGPTSAGSLMRRRAVCP